MISVILACVIVPVSEGRDQGWPRSLRPYFEQHGRFALGATTRSGARRHRFMRKATLRQLTLLGFPKPGDPYWTPETLAGVAARYPSLDMSPWRDAWKRTTAGRD